MLNERNSYLGNYFAEYVGETIDEEERDNVVYQFAITPDNSKVTNSMESEFIAHSES